MSFTRIAVCALAVLATPCAAQTADRFEWPDANPNVLPDARLGEVVESAKEAARQGADRAWEARKVALQARVKRSLRGAVGLGGKPTIIAAGTVMTAVPFNGEGGVRVGTVTYPSGASMTGAFGPDLGIYDASFTSSIAEFAGWCFGARTSSPDPMDGEYRFRSGDTFVGTRSADTYEGVYESADHTRKFVGTMLLNTASPRPVRGIMKDGHGHLLMTVGAGE